MWLFNIANCGNPTKLGCIGAKKYISVGENNELGAISMEKRLLNIAVRHWNDRFTGISALDIAEKFKITNADAMKLMESLCQKGDGTINANVTLYQVNFKFDKKTKAAKISDPEPVETHIFFPSKLILKRHFERNLLKYHKDGEYKNKLRRGFGQIALIYFDIKVLSKYLDSKECYDLNDDVTGGVLRLQHSVVTKITEEEYDEIGFDKIWYGKRRLESGETIISAILIDLSKLPFKEQSYWHGFEIDNPLFVQYDSDFAKFVARAYDGEWVESNDPIENLYKEIERINSLLAKPIFIKTANPYLNYPTNNSFKDFVDANSELYKIVGPDNLNLNNLRSIYLTSFKGNVKNLVHKESKRDLSTMQVLLLILTKLDAQIGETFKKNWTELKEYRVEGDHKITQPKKGTENYIDKFRMLCENTFQILKSISESLTEKSGA